MEAKIIQNRLVEPIFLMCSERIGSNLITKMFDAHPEIAAPGTSHLFRVFADVERSYSNDIALLRRDIKTMFEVKVSTWLIDAMTTEDNRILLHSDTCAGRLLPRS